jgi:DNA-binding PucR family transcriptional regulator
MYRLRRTVSIQNHLLELVTEEGGVDFLLTRVSDLLKAAVFLFDENGGLACQAGPNPPTADAQQLFAGYLGASQGRGHSGNFSLAGHGVTYREILVSGTVLQVLLAVRNADEPLPDLADNVLAYAQKLLSFHLLKERDRTQLLKEMRSSLLDDLVSGMGTEAEFLQRMRYFGLDAEEEWRIAVLDIRDFHLVVRGRELSEEQVQHLKRSFQSAVDDRFHANRVPCLTATKTDAVLALFPSHGMDPSAIAEWCSGLIEDVSETIGLPVDAGVSAPGRGALTVPRAAAQAKEGLRIARLTGPAGTAGVFDRLDPHQRLLATQPVESLEAVIEQTLGRLIAYDKSHHSHLVETVRVYIDSGFHMGQTSHALHVHRNTLRQRLARAEKITGRRLNAIHDAVDLLLGFRALDQLHSQGFRDQRARRPAGLHT